MQIEQHQAMLQVLEIIMKAKNPCAICLDMWMVAAMSPGPSAQFPPPIQIKPLQQMLCCAFYCLGFQSV
jgi:hypothetical protein